MARGQLGSGHVAGGVAQQARRFRMGHAAMAARNGTGAACRSASRAWSKRNLPTSARWARRKSGVRLLAAATLLEHGSDAQKKKFLRRILTGEDTWCQFFSEPGSGSDLAGATTRADLNGDYWIVNGQKVWTTSAHHADHGLLLARTDWDAPKHEGLSYFVIDVKQPGRRRAAAQADERPRVVQPGVLHRREGPAGEPGRPRRRGMEGRDDDARARAPRRRRAGATPSKRGSRQGTNLRRGARRNRKGESSPTDGIRSAPAAWISSSSARRKPARTRILTCARKSPS